MLRRAELILMLLFTQPGRRADVHGLVVRTLPALAFLDDLIIGRQVVEAAPLARVVWHKPGVFELLLVVCRNWARYVLRQVYLGALVLLRAQL